MRKGELRSLTMDVVERMYKIQEMDACSLQRLTEARDFLKSHPDWNSVVVMNHVSFGDPPLASVVVGRSLDPDQDRDVIMAASEYHTNFFHNPVFAAAHAVIGKGLYGYYDMRLIQGYMVREGRYTPEQAQANYRKAGRMINSWSKKHDGRGVDLIIFPEGSRSIDGTLQPLEEGAVWFAQMLMPCMILPLGITYEPRVVRDSPNFGKKVFLTVGKPMMVEKGKDGRVEDREVLMEKLTCRLREAVEMGSH